MASNGDTQEVIINGKEARRIARAAKAGLKILCPRPPKSSLTKNIAKKLPKAGIHRETVEGRIRAKRIPVTTLLPSKILIFLLVII